MFFAHKRNPKELQPSLLTLLDCEQLRPVVKKQHQRDLALHFYFLHLGKYFRVEKTNFVIAVLLLISCITSTGCVAPPSDCIDCSPFLHKYLARNTVAHVDFPKPTLHGYRETQWRHLSQNLTLAIVSPETTPSQLTSNPSHVNDLTTTPASHPKSQRHDPINFVTYSENTNHTTQSKFENHQTTSPIELKKHPNYKHLSSTRRKPLRWKR